MKSISKLSIMLIDDNEIDNFVNHKVIEITKCAQEIAVYNSANTALDYLYAYSNDSSRIPDLIFLDLNMPIIDGFEFLSEFEKLSGLIKEKVRIIILSSSGRSMDVEKAFKNKNVIDYISKPLTSDILSKCIIKNGINSTISF